MDRRSFLFFLPWIAASSKIVARSFVDLGAHTSHVLTEAEIVAMELERLTPFLPSLFERDDKFFSKVAEASIISSRDMRVPLIIKPGGNFGGGITPEEIEQSLIYLGLEGDDEDEL